MSARTAIVVLRKRASHQRGNTQHVKIIPGNQLALGPIGLPVERHAHAERKARQHSTEYSVAVPKVLVHGIRESILTADGSTLRAGLIEQNQLLWMLHRQGTQ